LAASSDKIKTSDDNTTMQTMETNLEDKHLENKIAEPVPDKEQSNAEMDPAAKMGTDNVTKDHDSGQPGDEPENEQANQNDVKEQQQIDMDQDQTEGQTSDVSYVFRSLETLQMHIDILYKSVPFLDRSKIQKNLLKFKKQKQ